MPVTIRLARYGRKKRPFYRIVAADSHKKRDGRYLEALGTLDPLSDPPTVELQPERVKHWISLGARPSDTVSNVIEKQIPGFLSGLETARKEKVRSKRAARKSRQKAS